jgi:hypothetical protein
MGNFVFGLGTMYHHFTQQDELLVQSTGNTNPSYVIYCLLKVAGFISLQLFVGVPAPDASSAGLGTLSSAIPVPPVACRMPSFLSFLSHPFL